MEWVTEGRIGVPDSLRSTQKIALLTSSDAADKHLQIELLNARAAMLADVRNLASMMKRYLRDLIRGLKP